eukprot:g5366.t1
MRLQSRSTVSVDFGPTGQEIPSSWEALTLPTENGMPYNDLVKLRVSSSAAKIFSKNKTSIDVSLGCSETGGTGIRLIGGKTTAEFTSIADVKTLRDGVRSPGTMNVVVNGVQPGYYEISSRHHEFDGSGQVFINSIVEGEAVGHGIVSSTGYGNLSLLDPRFGLHSSLLHIPKSSNSNIDISFVSFQSDRTFESATHVRNARDWVDSDSNGVANYWKISTESYGTIKTGRCSQDNNAFEGAYQRVQGVSAFKIFHDDVFRRNVPYVLQLKYRSNATRLHLGVSGSYNITRFQPTSAGADIDNAPSFLYTVVVSSADAPLMFEGEGAYAYLDMDEIQVSQLFEDIGTTDSWTDASNICKSRNARLCKAKEICPAGSGLLPIFGDLRSSSTSYGATDWLPVLDGTKTNTYVTVATKYKNICNVSESYNFNLTYGGDDGNEFDIKQNLLCCQDYDQCTVALGMESGKIKDSQLSTNGDEGSFILNKRVGVSCSNPGCHINGWKLTGEWVKGTTYYQVDLLESTWVSGIATQGRGPSGTDYVKTFQVKYSADGDTFGTVETSNGDTTFQGNVDASSIVRNTFGSPVVARYVRVFPLTVSGTDSASRFEFYGGPATQCSTNIGYGSGVYVRSALTKKYLNSLSAKFENTVAGVENVFLLTNSNSAASVGAGTVLYGNKIFLKSFLTHRYLSYNIGAEGVTDTNVARQNPKVGISVSSVTSADSLEEVRNVDPRLRKTGEPSVMSMLTVGRMYGSCLMPLSLTRI